MNQTDRVLASIGAIALVVSLVAELSRYISPQTAMERQGLALVIVLSLGGIAGIGGLYFNRRTILNTRELEAQRAREAALQNYLEQIGKLLVDHSLRASSPSDNVSIVARSQTLAALEDLDPSRKRILLQFLYASDLISRGHLCVSIRGANLNYADLRAARLQGIHLSETYLMGANLSGANLLEADLKGAQLNSTTLRGTNLTRASLEGIGTNLRYADLSGCIMIGSNLSEARLRGAVLKQANLLSSNLSNASLLDTEIEATNLTDADLGGTDLRGVNLQGAIGLQQAQIERAIGNQMTKLPNGLRHPISWSD